MRGLAHGGGSALELARRRDALRTRRLERILEVLRTRRDGGERFLAGRRGEPTARRGARAR